MRRLLGAVLATILLLVVSSSSRAGDSDAKSILDKAIAALGGAEKLTKIEAFSMKAKGTVVIDGKESHTTSEVIYKGLDHFRREFGNDQFHGVIVVDGDKGWRKPATTPARLTATASPTRSAMSTSWSSQSHSCRSRAAASNSRPRGRRRLVTDQLSF